MLVRVKFHGTRGSVLQPNNTVRYGGHTSCCGEGCFADSCRSIAERTGGKKIANLDPSNRKMI